ncbi:T9SS type A sorting domain-containing protein [Flavobacterium psychrotolerans]|uniref:Secretion system C-terminal sorting domain-containing protein n=1 Tax=Flavobacterium psychrotolerans TaxID=2169410 RepID=A0A2U1JMU3_9FLAO|nr:T9SS type A sorting domain-containing protein [Flavobacterium psychrotolerans]PWA06487.1 hypothetical protein DB895_03445 [Flavobacterium psychrotolerans]
MKLKLFITLALLCNMLFANAVPDVVNRKYDLREEVAVNQITCSASSTSLCQGTSVALTFIANGTYNTGNVFTAQLSDASGSFVSPVNIGTKSALVSGTIPAIIPSNAIAGTGYRIRVVASSLATIGLDNGTNITVFQAPIASISGMSTICSGSRGTVTFTGTPNATVTYAINGGPNQTIVLDATGNATLMTSPLSVSSTYSLVSVASSGSVCSKILSKSAMINVIPLPVAAISTSTPTVCSGSTGTVTFTGTPNVTVTYKVNFGANQTILLGTGGTATITTPIVTDSTTYSLVSATSSGGCSQALSGNVTIAVYSAPTGNSLQGPCVSDPSDATLASFILVGTNIKWYDASSGGLLLPLTTVLTDAKIYWASQTNPNTGCESSRCPVKATVMLVPVPTGNALQMFCNDPLNPPTVASLVASGNNNWYAVATGGFRLAPTTPLVDGQSYYATTVSLPCESTTRFKVTALVTNNAVTLSGNQGICVGLTTVFSPSAAGGTWISSSPAVATINPATGVITGVSAGTATMIYSVTGTGGCPDATSTRNVTVNSAPNAGSNAIVSICSNSGPIDLFLFLGATAQPGGIWTPALVSGKGIFNPSVDAAGQYVYTVAGSSSCLANTAMVTVTIRPNEMPIFTPIAPICSGSTLAPLPTTSTNGISGTWSPSLNNIATTTYTFTPDAGQCATRTLLTITVSSNPVMATFNCDPTLATSSNSVFFDWSNVVGYIKYNYTYSINGGASITGSTQVSHYEVFGVSEGQNVTFGIVSVEGVPCFLPSLITCSLPCKTNVTPIFPPIAPICSGGTLAPLLTTSLNGISGTWTPALNNTATTTYTFSPNAGQCATSSTLTITVNLKPKFIKLTNYFLCDNDNDGSVCFNSRAKDAEITGGNTNLIVEYYTSPNGGNILPNTICMKTGFIQLFFAKVYDPLFPDCYLINSFSVNAIPLPIPKITTVNDMHEIYVDNTTVAQPLLLDSQLSGIYSFQWYEDGAAIIGANSATYLVNIFSPNGIRNYTVDVTNSATGCMGTSLVFTVSQSPVPAPSGNRLQYFTAGQTLANLEVAGSGILWHSGPTNRSASSNVLPMNTLLVNGMTYYASQTINGYESPTRLDVKVQVTLSNNQFKFKDLKYSPNPIVDVLHIQSEDVIKKVSVCNTLGQEVYRQKCNTLELHLELSYLVSGNYFIKVESDSKQQVFKVIKK